ncbi:MAG: hypothetical protein E7294_08725 [Lachnospiraceae bacterium]|nr:hypothetical protein [Lachnospiraceae bacterium]
MDEIRRLEIELRELQDTLERQRAEAARMRRELSEENRQKLSEYEKQMRGELKAHDRETQKEYERRLREYQRSVRKEMQDKILKMDLDYQRLLMSTNRKEKEWQEKTGQLEALIEELKQDTTGRQQENDSEAKKYMAQAFSQFHEVEEKPHEKFCPGRLASFEEAIDQAQSLCRGGLYEAAIAVAISACSGLGRLGVDIEESFGEWTGQFELFRSRTEFLQKRLDDELAGWITYVQEFILRPEQLSGEMRIDAERNVDYWTGGVYGRIKKLLETCEEEIQRAQGAGITRYLKRENSLSLEELKENCAALEEAEYEWEQAEKKYLFRYKASCERVNWGELMIDYMEDELNLTWLEEESHFREVSEEAGRALEYEAYMRYKYGEDFERVDTREWLELVFVNSMETKIFVYLVPDETEDNVINRVVIYVDYPGAVNEEYSRQIYRHVCESIRMEEGDGRIDFVTDAQWLQTSENALLRETGRSLESKLTR